MAASQVAVKRAYDPPAKTDGRRVLVDRIWPRGVTKDELKIDGWLKEIAPSSALRKWFGHDPKKWGAFKTRYFHELDRRPELIQELLALRGGGLLTLVFAAKDDQHNNAVALKAYLERRGSRK